MSELQNIETDLHALEQKIDAWFEKHFGSLQPESDVHTAAIAAQADLKTVVGITPAPASVPSVETQAVS